MHGVVSGSAVEKITKSPMEKLVITDSIAATDDVAKCKKIDQLSVASLIGEAARRISDERSISALFK